MRRWRNWRSDTRREADSVGIGHWHTRSPRANGRRKPKRRHGDAISRHDYRRKSLCSGRTHTEPNWRNDPPITTKASHQLLCHYTKNGRRKLMLIQIEATSVNDLLADDEMLVPTVEDALLDTLINYRDTNKAPKARPTTALNIRITITPTTTEVHRNGNGRA